MSTPLVVFMMILLLPLFMASWRTSLFGIAGQGLLMGYLAYARAPELTAEAAATLVDLAVVRGLVVPIVLYRVLRTRGVPRRNDVIPPNLLSWTAVLVLLLLAFRFAAAMPMAPTERPFVAVATAALVLGFFVLATQVGVFSQMIAAMRIANAIAMFELGMPGADGAWWIRGLEIAALLVTVALFRWYLLGLTPAAPAPTEEAA
jgi:hydrogenase-4 membrane subunit HyfE